MDKGRREKEEGKRREEEEIQVLETICVGIMYGNTINLFVLVMSEKSY